MTHTAHNPDVRMEQLAELDPRIWLRAVLTYHRNEFDRELEGVAGPRTRVWNRIKDRTDISDPIREAMSRGAAAPDGPGREPSPPVPRRHRRTASIVGPSTLPNVFTNPSSTVETDRREIESIGSMGDQQLARLMAALDRFA